MSVELWPSCGRAVPHTGTGPGSLSTSLWKNIWAASGRPLSHTPENRFPAWNRLHSRQLGNRAPSTRAAGCRHPGNRETCRGGNGAWGPPSSDTLLRTPLHGAGRHRPLPTTWSHGPFPTLGSGGVCGHQLSRTLSLGPPPALPDVPGVKLSTGEGDAVLLFPSPAGHAVLSLCSDGGPLGGRAHCPLASPPPASKEITQALI